MVAECRCGQGPAVEVTTELEPASKDEAIPRVKQSFL
jgi:hypothetical protein